MTTPHLSTLALHKLRYGELGEAERRAAGAHLEACPVCRRRLGVQERTREEFVLQPVPADLQGTLASPARARSPRRGGASSWVQRLLLPWALVAAAAVFVGVPALRAARSVEAAEVVRTKGGASGLEIWIDRDGPRALRGTDVLHAGDRVQVLYDPEGAPFVAVAGRDPTGEIQVWGHLRPERDGLQPAPFALTLDTTPGFQEIVVVRSPFELTPDEVRRAVLGRSLPAGVEAERVLLPKR